MRAAQAVERRPEAPVLALHPSHAEATRPHVAGKFFRVNDREFYVRGVAYGPFRPTEDGCEYHTEATVDRDFAAMAAAGINVVRVYTVPPGWLLDCATRHGLFVMIGIPWEQHITFFDDGDRLERIERRVRDAVRTCAGHSAVFCFAVGNEIPAQIVRWYGARRVERFIRRLYDVAKRQDPGCIVTYVNFPTTEYLDLKFLDFQCFNVYLETPEKLRAYVARLQNIAGDRPLILGELGLDSRRNGPEAQASTLDWQIRLTFESGAAGVFVFSWTDEWFRGGHDIADWGFGLTDRNRVAKPALRAVSEAYRDAPFRPNALWPRISVVVCTYNGARTIQETCEALRNLEYPDFEVIVVCDGCTDETVDIVIMYAFRVIRVPNGGLSCARNIGMQAATGEIVAYLDDDAYPNPQWLQYLASAFMHSSHAGIGGPNVAPLDDALVAQCVSHSPGGPNHVLLDDTTAEHIPGCNMAFRKSVLERVNGFDGQFRIAGDDVDLCWRIQEEGETLGFSAGAMVWHHRRNRVRAYLRQQYNYGRAEAMLAHKWPTKYNGVGHVSWGGRIYGSGSPLPFLSTRRIYHGTWGSAPFQSIYDSGGIASSIPSLPEWYLVILVLAALTGVGVFLWPPLQFALIPLIVAVAIPAVYAFRAANAAPAGQFATEAGSRFRARALIAFLHLAQPFVRLRGRISEGLRPWKWPRKGLSLLGFRSHTVWLETWASSNDRLLRVEKALESLGARTRRGGNFDNWDLELRGGLLAGVRVRMVVEEHGAGKQVIRFRTAPTVRGRFFVLAGGATIGLAASVAFDASTAAIVCGLSALLCVFRAFSEAAASASKVRRALPRGEELR
jgi:GT2 family glycosyltransferase